MYTNAPSSPALKYIGINVYNVKIIIKKQHKTYMTLYMFYLDVVGGHACACLPVQISYPVGASVLCTTLTQKSYSGSLIVLLVFHRHDSTFRSSFILDINIS